MRVKLRDKPEVFPNAHLTHPTALSRRDGSYGLMLRIKPSGSAGILAGFFLIERGGWAVFYQCLVGDGRAPVAGKDAGAPA